MLPKGLDKSCLVPGLPQSEARFLSMGIVVLFSRYFSLYG